MRAAEARFYTGASLAIIAAVFVGFAPTYYLKDYFRAAPLPLLVHFHGLVFTAWILLFLTQTSLVAARRIDLHRRLGLDIAVCFWKFRRILILLSHRSPYKRKISSITRSANCLSPSRPSPPS